MDFEIHPNAAAAFNSEADALLAKCVEFPVAEKRFDPERHKINLPPGYENLIKLKMTSWEAKLVTGETILLLFQTQEGAIGLSPDDYEHLKTLSTKIGRTDFLKRFVSNKNVREALTDWLTERKQNKSSASLCDHLTTYFAPQIKEMQLWIPLEATYVEGEFEIGDVIIRPVTEAMCAAWWQKRVKWVSENIPQRLPAEWNEFDHFRRKVQGYAACIINVVAEPDKAKEIAYEKAHSVATFLCCFSPTAVQPRANCHTLPLGHGNIRTFTYFTVENSEMHSLPSGIEDTSEWFLDTKQIELIQSMGLCKISEIIKKKTKSHFEGQLLSALQLYGKSPISMTMGDKLLYIVTALESLLVKDSNESLTQNVSERLAFAITHTGTERQAVITNYRETYALRSKFVHHGQGVEDEEKVEIFMLNARKFLTTAIAKSNEFTSKEEFIQAIEKVKYEGGVF